MDGPSFQYWYGASFVLTVLSFTTAELTGVQAVYLYISRHKHAYRKKVKRLATNISISSRQHSAIIHVMRECSCHVKRLATSSSTGALEQHQLSGGPLVNVTADLPRGPLVNDVGDLQGPMMGRGGFPLQGGGPYQQGQVAAPNHYAPLGPGRPNGRVVGAMEGPGAELGARSPYLASRHGLQQAGGGYLAAVASVGRVLAGYADTASYNGSVLMRGSPLGSAIYRRSMDSLLLPSEHQSAASLGDVARRTTPV